MILHVLNGDALNDHLPAHFNNRIAFRDCLIEGPSDYNSIVNHWLLRQSHFKKIYEVSDQEFNKRVRYEIERINHFNHAEEICLWFEFDLYCQINMWFLINYLESNEINIATSWAFPNHKSWKGFGAMDHRDINESFENRITFSLNEIESLKSLWQASCDRNMDIVNSLSQESSRLNQLINPSLRALCDLYPSKGLSRPLNILKELNAVEEDFGITFRKFSNLAGEYGYGDLQVRNLIKLLEEND